MGSTEDKRGNTWSPLDLEIISKSGRVGGVSTSPQPHSPSEPRESIIIGMVYRTIHFIFALWLWDCRIVPFLAIADKTFSPPRRGWGRLHTRFVPLFYVRRYENGTRYGSEESPLKSPQVTYLGSLKMRVIAAAGDSKTRTTNLLTHTEQAQQSPTRPLRPPSICSVSAV
ncbi:hypothetical protein JTE90_006839 [Oedothorax gibbosus]|uniref:Uncharacterized protein n=1 Tax=Oedothorax gibbosus TaxID=931172 RepID=A0AAV6TWP1_9ARAC|nr:hypothetical protein JTE90_006839 [Oedothorax gibbosus]